jgi:cytosine/adenosine deaminase-related metal-dependent hydrolase
MTLYLADATYVDWQSLNFFTGHIAVGSGPGKELRFVAELPTDGALGPDDTIVDCRRRLVTKSFACGHHHIYSALARGMPAPPKIPKNFVEILENIWWRLDRALDSEMIEASALVCALYCLKNGVTFVIDHHASPFAVCNSLETIAQAFDRVGISHLLCYEISDRDGEAIGEQGLAETQKYLGAGHQGHVGLHASFTVGDVLLKKAVALANQYHTGIHVHVAEDLADQIACRRTYGRRVVERFCEAGVLDLPQSILAHCIHLSENEKELLRQSPVWVAQNVESNLNNNVGLADYRQLEDRVMLGTDGMHSDMLRSAKAAYLSGQATEGIDMRGIYERLRNVHRYIGAHGFAGDGANNLVILDYNAPTAVTCENFLSHLVYGLDAAHVDSVVSNGRLVVHHQKILTVDEDEILAFAAEMGNKLWRKLIS